ncbi:hypothetical protein BDV98DRAFT_342138 [Pterulicium gracile]|uniref:Uncharacterized protein n=1 Tax=Pterulicium gracile TaxID=1884261 RepID=A0A5C3Q1S9_9AGAR|nr:hypothetical protein BDV98DRAFT_342138 [Pterula gracilis]
MVRSSATPLPTPSTSPRSPDGSAWRMILIMCWSLLWSALFPSRSRTSRSSANGRKRIPVGSSPSYAESTALSRGRTGKVTVADFRRVDRRICVRSISLILGLFPGYQGRRTQQEPWSQRSLTYALSIDALLQGAPPHLLLILP